MVKVTWVVHLTPDLLICHLQSVLLLELKVLLVEGVDTVNHGLDKLNLRVTQTMLVGDVISGT